MPRKVDPTRSKTLISRRKFLGVSTAGVSAALGGGMLSRTALAEVAFPKELGGWFGGPLGGGGSAAGAVHRAEVDLFDCEVEGKLPKDLDGAFYRVGPDPQYPKDTQYASDCLLDGEGHVSMFRIRNGHVDYRSRYVKNERWRAQHEARRSLFGMYRNPLTDDPSVQGLSRGTANTQLFVHHGKLLVLKEDSPPVVLDPHTLETIDDYYTYGGKLKSLTHTAHPKIDAVTGELVAFGYQATGFASNDVHVFSVDRSGAINWGAWIKVPYSGMLHDFAVTQRHIVFHVVPLVTHLDRIRAGQLHYAWDSTLSNYMGVLRRGGDGSDVRWYKGPLLSSDHTMGAWSDGDQVYVDMDGGEGNHFAFFQNLHEPFDPVKAAGRVNRFKIDARRRTGDAYQVETLHPGVSGVFARQDDRYHSVPYRYGFLTTFGTPESRWIMLDHQTGTSKAFYLPDYDLDEVCFVPRRRDAAEGDGYLVGVGYSRKEHGRADLVLVDTQDLSTAVARVKMPFRVATQIHGFWASKDQLPPEETGKLVVPARSLEMAMPISPAKERFPASWKRPVYNLPSGDPIGTFGATAMSHRA